MPTQTMIHAKHIKKPTSGKKETEKYKSIHKDLNPENSKPEGRSLNCKTMYKILNKLRNYI
jgi:hypothetical protein